MKNLIKLIFVLTFSTLLYNCENNTEDLLETNQVLTPREATISLEKQNVEFTQSINSSDPCDGVAEFDINITSYVIGDSITYAGSLYVMTAIGWDYLGACGIGPSPCDGIDLYNGDDSTYLVGDHMVYKGSLFVKTASGWDLVSSCGS